MKSGLKAVLLSCALMGASPSVVHAQSDAELMEWGQNIANVVGIATGTLSLVRFVNAQVSPDPMKQMATDVSALGSKLDELHVAITDSKEEILLAIADLKDTVIAQKEEELYIDVYSTSKHLQSYVDLATQDGFSSFGSRRIANFDRIAGRLIELSHASEAQSSSFNNGLYLVNSNYILAASLYQLYYADIRNDTVDITLYRDAIDSLIKGSDAILAAGNPLEKRRDSYTSKYESSFAQFISGNDSLSFLIEDSIYICANKDFKFSSRKAERSHVRCPVTDEEANNIGRRLRERDRIYYMNYTTAEKVKQKCDAEDKRHYPSYHTFDQEHFYEFERIVSRIPAKRMDVGNRSLIVDFDFGKPMLLQTIKDETDPLERYVSDYEMQRRVTGEYQLASTKHKPHTIHCSSVWILEYLNDVHSQWQTAQESMAMYARIATQNDQALEMAQATRAFLIRFASDLDAN